jgi:adenylyl-sulfate kinase
MTGKTIWLTGLPCSGKTTIALELEKQLAIKGHDVELLDGDLIRKTISKDLGFSKEDREENNRRVAERCKVNNEAGKITLVSLVSPFDATREKMKELIGADNFVLVFVNTPLSECIKRDVKGMYAQAIKGEIERFTGVSDPYEIPYKADVVIETLHETVEESVERLFELV